MGRAFTETGIQIGLADGNLIASGTTKAVDLRGNPCYINFGTGFETYIANKYSGGTAYPQGTMSVISLGHKIMIESDEGAMQLYTNANLKINFGTKLIFLSNDGTVATLDTSGNLLIGGTLGQSKSF